MAVLSFDAFWRDHGAKAGLKGLSREAQDATKRQAEFRKEAVVAGAAVGAALFKLGKDAIAVASDIGESQSKVRVVFGKSATAVEQLAETSARSMGISKAAALDAAGTFGNLFVSMKLPQAESAKLSTKLIGLAADMASFNNATPDEALEALRAGLLGEAEPLRRFGVNLNEAAIKAEALRLGLVKTTADTGKISIAQKRAQLAQEAYTKAVRQHGEKSEQARRAAVTLESAQRVLNKAVEGSVPELNAAQKAQATYSLIMDQTKTAQGDFARTSDGLANSSRILKAEFSDLQGELGTKLLPVAVKVTRSLIDLLGFIDEHRTGVALTAAAIGGLVVAVKGLQIASSVVESWGNLTAAIGGARDKAAGAKTALGKVAGFVGAGGPWGIAFAGAATLIGAFAIEQQKAKAHVDTLSGAIDKQTGALSDLGRQEVVNSLQQRGAFQAARELGIGLDTLTDAALGNAGAQKKVNEAVRVASERYKALTPEQRVSNEWAKRLDTNIKTLTGAIGSENTALAEARRKTFEAADANKTGAQKARDHAAAVAELARETRRLPKSKTVTIGARVVFPKDWQQYRSGERMATGGPVGDGVGTVDDVPALLMRGEHVWTTRDVAGAGGHDAVMRIRAAARAGTLRGYADGGPVGLTVPNVRRGMGRVESMLEGAAITFGRYLQKQLDAAGFGRLSGGWLSQWNVLRRAFPGAQLYSSYRPGAITATGNQSYHALGRAIDVTPSMAIFDWIRSHYGARSKELIYSPAGGRQMKNGRNHYYGEPVRGMHWNHVHWAYDRGGVADGAGWMLKATNAPERVLSPRQTELFERLVMNPAGAGTGSVTVILNAPNYLGSQNELKATLATLWKQGRLDRYTGRR